MPKNFGVRLRRLVLAFLPRLKQLILPAVLIVLLLVLLAYRPLWQSFLGRLIRSPQFISNLSRDPAESLRSTNQRTNILLLGMGGASHEAGDLTDSMILVSYSHASGKLSLISLPRDLWVDSLKTKINAAYYWGEQRQAGGGGLILSKAAVEEVTGLPVHYALAIDFTGFKQAIDLIGGVDVNVEKGFDDYEYPISGKEAAYPVEARYEHLHFDAGTQHMDGSLALKFVRSRHAEGEEGTDFARSARQRQVILAFKNKALSSQTLLQPNKLAELANLYDQYIHTDITDADYGAFTRLALEVKPDQVQSISLSTGEETLPKALGILEVGNKNIYQGQYVLIARDGNWATLKQYLTNQLGN